MLRRVPSLAALPIALLLASAGCGKGEVYGLNQADADVDGAILYDSGEIDGSFEGEDGAIEADAGDDGGLLPDQDGGRPRRDGGVRRDGGMMGGDGGAFDGGRPRRDGGVRMDSGVEPDASQPIDGGVIFVDGGGPIDGGVVFVDGGAVDSGPAPECTQDSDCGFRGHCEATSGTCVDCLQDSDCGFNRVCDIAGGYVCRAPCVNDQCGPFGVCDPSSNVCVECLQDSDCSNGQLCDPATKSCVDCLSNNDCALAAGRPICSPSNDVCVACASSADCPANEQCNLAGTRAAFCAPTTGRTLCSPCTVDDQCEAGGLCLGTGPANAVDRACGRDCSQNAGGCPAGYACESVRNGAAHQCRPSYPMQNPTCVATRHIGEPCPYSQAVNDPGCGLPGVQDARCVPDAAGAGVCSVWCNTDQDCAIGTCTGASPGQTGTCQ